MIGVRFMIGIIAGSVLGLTSTPQASVDEGCVTSKCHAEMGTKPFVHGPVGAKLCTVCHKTVPEKKHQFVLAAQKQELCFSCHETSRDMMLKDHQHKPVAEGNCVACHDPHQSDYRYTLKGRAADLCYKCHDRQEFSQAFVHGPVGAGDCNVCHNPHASDNVAQLQSPPEQICFNCHKDQAGMLSKRHVHPPVKEACTKCHSPHSNAKKFLLSDAVPQLCIGCHDEYGQLSSLSHQHKPASDGECLKCHNVHASDNPRMFPMPQGELCFSCHSETSELVAAKTNKHGPVKQGDCNACHNPHGSENFRVLRQAFPSQFYMPYASENYSLCFNCHNKTVAVDSLTTTLTDFRDGDRNLHFTHVNKSPKGRSCKACHQVHASDQAKHVRESVPFGTMNWELPVTFTKLADGGSCVVGCHAPKEYHRK